MSDAEKFQWILIGLLVVNSLLMRTRHTRLVNGTNKAIASHKKGIEDIAAIVDTQGRAIHDLTQAFSRVSNMFAEMMRER